MVRLGVNVDHVATLRQARRATEPDPVTAGLIAEMAGADNVTVHLREDRRHIQDRDVRLLREQVKTSLNLEMAATEEMIARAVELRPDSVCLVPERREEITTEGGLDVAASAAALGRVLDRLAPLGIAVGLFVDPDPSAIEAAAAGGFHHVELHTGAYANAPQGRAELDRLVAAARLAADRGLEVHAGHGLDYRNVQPVARIEQISEISIGHAIVARAVFVGLGQAVSDMVALVRQARSSSDAAP